MSSLQTLLEVIAMFGVTIIAVGIIGAFSRRILGVRIGTTRIGSPTVVPAFPTVVPPD